MTEELGEETLTNWRQRKEGMKKDEETVWGDLKGEEGLGKARDEDRSKDLVIQRLAAQSVPGLFSLRPWRRDLRGASVFELSAAEAAGRPGRRCDTIISAWRMAAGGRERQYPLHHHPSAALPEASSLGATYSPGHLSSPAKSCLAHQAGHWESIQKLL